jgi:hypothetical protein
LNLVGVIASSSDCLKKLVYVSGDVDFLRLNVVELVVGLDPLI